MEDKNNNELSATRQIEEAIWMFQKEPTEEMLAHALTVIRHKMNEGVQVIAAINIPSADKIKEAEDGTPYPITPRIIQIANGTRWWMCFTCFEEELLGKDKDGGVMSTFWVDLKQLFEAALTADDINGIIINPWNRRISMDKKLIKITLGKKK